MSDDFFDDLEDQTPQRQGSHTDPTQFRQPTARFERDRTQIHRALQEQEVDHRASGLYLPWWAFAIAILVVAALTCGLWAYVLANRGGAVSALGPTPTPIFVVITSTATLAPPDGAGPAGTQDTTNPPDATATDTPIPLPPDTPTPAVSTLHVGMRVTVTGTEGFGLAVRQGPGVDYTYFFVANDGEEFVIEDGPRQADDYEWWYIQDPNDENRAGWAAGPFLQPVES